ncbi:MULTISPECIES: hypothetical protein [unclassified Curtobacterium]|uniref:hypothetical protein n=1 Tax=unclassified Curtobacterium TaxID=257496 RepID=UPI003A7FFFD8
MSITETEFTQRIADIDARFQARIRNQIASINRVLAGATYDDEMATLHEQLATVTAERDQLRIEADQLNKQHEDTQS